MCNFLFECAAFFFLLLLSESYIAICVYHWNLINVTFFLNVHYHWNFHLNVSIVRKLFLLNVFRLFVSITGIWSLELSFLVCIITGIWSLFRLSWNWEVEQCWVVKLGSWSMLSHVQVVIDWLVVRLISDWSLKCDDTSYLIIFDGLYWAWVCWRPQFFSVFILM
jgi:hypothetical protein